MTANPRTTLARQVSRHAALWVVALLLPACGEGASEDRSASELREPPSRGEAWHLEPGGSPQSGPGELLAFLHGLDHLVLDREQIYAGRRSLPVQSAPGGGAWITAGAERIEVNRAEGRIVLRFAGGEEATLIPRTPSSP